MSLRDPWDCAHKNTQTVPSDHECGRPHHDCGPSGSESHEEVICRDCGATLEVR